MEATDVLDVLTLLAHARVEVRVEGGWGVDALLGAQHRDHEDLDLVVDEGDGAAALEALVGAGFEVINDDGPGRYALADRSGREVDLSIVAADRYGDRWNLNRRAGRGEPDYPVECFTYGWIGGQKVACLGPETQAVHHTGYEIEPVDRWDLELLRERFDIALPPVFH